MGYTREEILNNCKEAIKTPKLFYKYLFKDGNKSRSVLVNYRGKTKESNPKENQLYTEIIAEFLSKEENFKCIFDIETHSRKEKRESYNVGHTGEFKDKKGNILDSKDVDHKKEKIIAIDLYNQSRKEGPFEYIGDIIDYQTPLKAERSDPYGEIDLISVNKDEKRVYIIELKKNKKGTSESPETMLRCILEAYTYYKIVDKEELLKDFGLEGYKIAIAPLVFRNDKQYEEWDEMKKGYRNKLKELINIIKKAEIEEAKQKGFDIVPFFLSDKNQEEHTYIVTKYEDE